MKSTPRTITKETRHVLCASKYGHCPAARIWIPSSDGNIQPPRLLVAKCTSTMVPFGVAEASQPLATRPEPGPPHGIAKRPERYRPTSVCKTFALPQTMVSPERPNSATAPPKCCGQPATKHSDPDGWYRRSVPTVGNQARTSPRKPRTPTARYRRSVPSETEPTHVCLSPARPTNHGIAGASRSRQRSPQSHLECAAPGRSSQCGTCGFPGLTTNPQRVFGPSWSVRLQAANRSMGPAVFLGSPPTLNTHFGPSWSVRLLAAPRSMGPAVFLRSPPTHSPQKSV